MSSTPTSSGSIAKGRSMRPRQTTDTLQLNESSDGRDLSDIQQSPTPSLESVATPTRKWKRLTNYWEDRKKAKTAQVNVSDTELQQISELTAGNYWQNRIEGRVVALTKSGGKTMDGKSLGLTIYLTDKSGSIVFKAFQNEAARLSSLLEIGKAYSVKGFTVTPGNEQFPTHSGHPFDVKLYRTTLVEPVEKDAIPLIAFKFKQIAEIDKMKEGDYVDTLGMVYKNYGLKTSKGPHPVNYRNIYITDKFMDCIGVTLWKQAAEDFGDEQQVAVAFRSIKLELFDGDITLNTYSNSTIWKNPALKEAEELTTWFKKQHEDEQ